MVQPKKLGILAKEMAHCDIGLILHLITSSTSTNVR